MTSAAPNAASVLPIPICASSINIPGVLVSLTAFITASWTAFGSNPNLSWKICLLILHTSECHSSGNCNRFHPSSTRVSQSIFSKSSSKPINGNNLVLLAIQSATISSPDNNTCASTVKSGISEIESKPLSIRASLTISFHIDSHCLLWIEETSSSP